MLVVREHFIAKPGQASKLAALMKDVMKLGGNDKCRIMTDLTGEFNRVVMESDVESLSAFESRMTDFGKNEAVKEKMKGYTEMYVSGGREIFRVVS